MDGLQHLPAPRVATGARIVCSAQQLGQKMSVKDLQASSVAATDSKKPTSTAIRHGGELAASIDTKTDVLKTPRSKLRQRRPADVFVADRDPGPIFSEQQELPHGATIFPPPQPLISIGPNSDAALDRFKLKDEILPELRKLVRTVRSSRWELEFRSQAWDLTYEQAFVLSRALLADLQGVPLNPVIVKVSNLLLLHICANVESLAHIPLVRVVRHFEVSWHSSLFMCALPLWIVCLVDQLCNQILRLRPAVIALLWHYKLEIV